MSFIIWDHFDSTKAISGLTVVLPHLSGAGRDIQRVSSHVVKAKLIGEDVCYWVNFHTLPLLLRNEERVWLLPPELSSLVASRYREISLADPLSPDAVYEPPFPFRRRPLCLWE